MDACVPHSISIKDGAKQCNQGEQKMPFPAKHDKRHNGSQEIKNDENTILLIGIIKLQKLLKLKKTIIWIIIIKIIMKKKKIQKFKELIK